MKINNVLNKQTEMYMTCCDKNPLELVSEMQKESERREIVWCIGVLTTLLDW